MTDGKLVITAKPHPRAGWEEEARRMMEFGDEAQLLNENDLTEFDRTEWEW